MGNLVRVTHVVFDLDGGGMESLIGAIVRRLAGSSIVTSVVSLSGRSGRVGTSIAPFLDQYHVVRPVRGISMIAPIGVARRIRQTRADVVHLHSGAWFKGAFAARLARTRRVIYTEHGREHDDPPLSRWLDRQAARWTDVVIPVSARLEAYLQTLGVPKERMETIENGVDLTFFSPGRAPEGLRHRFNLPEGARIVGSIGRLERVKGYDRLLEVFAHLKRGEDPRHPCYLVICGAGTQRESLVRQARDLGLEPYVRFPGWVDHPVEFYRLLDVFILTSRSEGLSLSLLEALACGVPAVVTAVGANEEVLGPTLRGQVISNDDWAAFADVVKATLASDDRRAEMGRLGRARVAARFNLDRLVERYASLYTAGTALHPTSQPPQQPLMLGAESRT